MSAVREFHKSGRDFSGPGVAIFLSVSLGAMVVGGMSEQGVALVVLVPVALVVGSLALAVAARSVLSIRDEFSALPVILRETEMFIPRQRFLQLRPLTLGYREISRIEHRGGRGSSGWLAIHHAGGTCKLTRSDYSPDDWDRLVRMLRSAQEHGRLREDRSGAR